VLATTRKLRGNVKNRQNPEVETISKKRNCFLKGKTYRAEKEKELKNLGEKKNKEEKI